MVPGAHLFIATNPLVSYLVYEPLISAGFEKRGEIIRLVQTLRGGDRPKNAEREFSQVSVMPRLLGAVGACFESHARAVSKTTCVNGKPAGCVAFQERSRFEM